MTTTVTMIQRYASKFVKGTIERSETILNIVLWYLAASPEEKQLLDLVNDARLHPENYPPQQQPSDKAFTQKCAKAFVPSFKLLTIARDHSKYLSTCAKDWVTQDKNMHRDPDGNYVWEKGEPMDQAGYKSLRSENVYMGYGVGFGTPAAAIKAWMQNDADWEWGHRNAILNCAAYEAAIGHFQGGPWGNYWTLDMGTK